MNVHDQVAARLLRVQHQDQIEREMREHSKVLRAAIGALVAKEDTVVTLDPAVPFDSAIIGVCVDNGHLRVVYDLNTVLGMYQQVMGTATMEETIAGFDQLMKGLNESHGGKGNLPLMNTPGDHVIGMYAMAKERQQTTAKT